MCCVLPPEDARALPVHLVLKMNLRETTVREIFKTQKSREKLEAKKWRQKQQRTNKNRKKTHRK
jgi:hypothetical protein